MCWESWGPEGAGRALAPMKVPPHQGLAISATVGAAMFSRAAAKLTAGTRPGWPVHTEHWVSGAGRRGGARNSWRIWRRKPQSLTRRPEAQVSGVSLSQHVQSPSSASLQGLGPVPPSRSPHWAPWVCQVRGRVGYMNPQTTALKVAVEKCVSFPV